MSIKLLPSTVGRIRNFQAQLKNFIGLRLGTARQITLESQFCVIIAKEERIRQKIGTIESEIVTLAMSARKFENSIQIIGATKWNYLSIELN